MNDKIPDVEKTKKDGPPRLARCFLRWYCRPELAEDLEGDPLPTEKTNVRGGYDKKSGPKAAL